MSTRLALIGSLCHGSCTIQPTSIAFSSEELLDMIARCGLNRLKQFATFLGNHLRESKTDPKLLQALVQLDEVLYGGLALGQEEEVWAFQNGVNLQVGRVSATVFYSLLTKYFPLIPNPYRTSLEVLKLALCCSRLAERVKTPLSWSLSREPHTASSPSSPTTNPRHPPPPARTPFLRADSWSSSSCPSLAIAPMSHSGTQTVTSTPVTSSSKSKPESTFLGVGETIGSRARAVSDAILSESA